MRRERFRLVGREVQGRACLLVFFLHTVGAHLTQDTRVSAVPKFPNFLRKTHPEEQGLLCAWVAESSDAGAWYREFKSLLCFLHSCVVLDKIIYLSVSISPSVKQVY